MATTQQYSLRWNNYFRHLTYALDNHRNNDDFVDVSLCCDGRKIKAHKVVLSSCSSYFKEIFRDNPHPHPVIIFKFIKFEDLTSIIEFMYQGEVNVQQEALQSFLQTAELLAVQGLTAEEKEKPKLPPTPIIDEQKLIKTIPSTIRAVNDVTTATQTTPQTIEIPTATILQQTQPQQQHHTATQHHHVQTQIQHIQVQHQPQPHVQTVQTQVQQQQTTTHQLQHHQQQQLQQTHLGALPSTNTIKKRKMTFSDDDDNIYTTEGVDYGVKDDSSIVKTAEMTFLRGTVKMDIPEYIVGEVDDSEQLTDGSAQHTSQDGGTTGTQNVTQYTSEYEILTESEIEEKFHQADAENAEITIEMGRLLNPTTSTPSTTTPHTTLDESGGSVTNAVVKIDNKGGASAVEEQNLTCKFCKRKLQSMNALRRHITSRHSEISGKEHECTICSKSFKTKWSLSTHNSRFHRDMRVTKECIKMEFT
ncbi:broad-complex core protein isoforms 1/2/3/4/5 isoform X1 [Bactrocera neohumeralis]|uniref:broad-complex core protein isoforms 1/2/3/4/5 isoform X1 n=1 Tax=Bactrocera tryoni TaxID=59916 RepID=UPI001A9848A3|nr:broad-complex core protein isoforms 1/2/3/4/5 isoform X1 [Bactrocera tryoni]XP_050331038.1 broad-complex core protein isoforms 1/2/3/4/5 isoform X1 [Bactrocera neohumeralis]